MHVVRYAGGKDLGDFGFGNAASSYYGKGNSLTGIDELDLYTTSNARSFAQVRMKDQQNSHGPQPADEHHKALQGMLTDAKRGFDDMLAKGRYEFASLANAETEESTERMHQLN